MDQIVRLFQQYTVPSIISIIALLIGGYLGIDNLIEYFKKKRNRLLEQDRQATEHNRQIQNRMKQQQKSIETLIKGQQLMQQNINKIFEKIDILIGSDTADIKMAIAQAYQTFCIERKCIDMYSLESLERRFEYYQKQGGNSFVASLMNQIKALPKVTTPPPAQQ